MRFLIVVGVLGGCYQPSTESCYYACATQGAPCPSGLTCVAGMCATPGSTTCGDGGIDSSSDAAGTRCGDGVAIVGEICFGTPLPFNAPRNPSFGQLADFNGDTNADLIWLDTTAYNFVFNTNGMLVPPAVQGPAVVNAGAMTAANLTNAPGVELINTTDLDIEGYTGSAADGSVQVFSRPTPQYPPALAIGFGPITASPIGALAVSHGSLLVMYRFDSLTTLVEISSHPIETGRDIAVGALNADGFGDVVVATKTGVVVFLGSSLNLGSPAQVGPSIVIERVAVGDFDNDGMADIAFTVGDAMLGSLGILRGRGNGTFQAATFTHLPALGPALAVADIDRDGRDDVVAFQRGLTPSVLVFRGKPDGSVDAPVAIPAAGSASHVSARGDFNDDKIPDIVVTDYSGNRVTVFPSKP